MPAIAISYCTAQASDRDRALASALQLPLVNADDCKGQEFKFILRYDSAGLTLYQNSAGAPGGLCIDFSNPHLLRRTSDKLKQQNLVKAIGIKSQQHLAVLDAMAGLGKDAWLLASGGAEVQMLERSPIVHALLQDGLARGLSRAMTGSSKASVLGRMQLRHADFSLISPELPVYDVVYLDPMFPSSNKNARAKKDMYLLQELLGDVACDELQLLSVAREHARRRVVVKRGKLSPYFAGARPEIEFKGSANRYDVYMCHSAIDIST